MARLILFDVNETLLDLSALDPFFKRVVRDPGARSEWFYRLEESWLTELVIGGYTPFHELARVALQAVVESRGVGISEGDTDEMIERMKSLPPFPDVEPALSRLARSGLRLAALTNGTEGAARAQLEHAQIAHHFETVLSADSVRRMKPAPEPYHMAMEMLGLAPTDIRMVACHAWDIAGAAAAGLATAFLRRPGKLPYTHLPAPDLDGGDLWALTSRIIEVDTPG